jgi:hypothetical protein
MQARRACRANPYNTYLVANSENNATMHQALRRTQSGSHAISTAIPDRCDHRK